MTIDPYADFKKAQKKAWGLFSPLEHLTTMTAPELVKFSGLTPHDTVLDAGCGTGVVAVTAAKTGAKVFAMDLSPELLERAKANSALAKVSIEFKEGDVEALPYKDNSFDVVLSQFGHMFAPRPQIAAQEMLRVLKPGGTIAFSTWPPDLFVGRLFSLVNKYFPTPAGVSPSSLWGDPDFVRQQLGDQVKELIFNQALMRFTALSIGHYLQTIESTLGPVVKLVQNSQSDLTELNKFRSEVEALAAQYYNENYIRQHYLLSRAKKLYPPS